MAENQTENTQPAIIMQTQYIKDLSLEIPHAPEIFKNLGEQPQIKIDVNINANPLEQNYYNVTLEFHIEGDIKGEKFFILEMTYGGVVQLNVPEEHIQPVLMIEIPHMLFPYARQAISNVMTNGGLPPLMLAPIDFVAMYKARAAQQEAAGKPAND